MSVHSAGPPDARSELQGARHRMATNGPEAWLGRRVIASGPSPLEPLNEIGRAPGAAAGAFLLLDSFSLPSQRCGGKAAMISQSASQATPQSRSRGLSICPPKCDAFRRRDYL